MKKRKQTTPLLSALTISMFCTSLAAAAGAHSIYQKYNTDGWSQPVIAVLMQGLANRDFPWSNAGTSAASGNAAIPSANHPNMDGLPVAIVGQPGSTVTGSGNDAAGQAAAGNQWNSTNGQSGTAAPDKSPDKQAGTVAPGEASGQAGNSASNGVSEQTENPASGNSSGQAENSAPSGSSEQTKSSGDETFQSENNLPASDTEPQPESRQYEFTNVTQEYFDDALLIGDSRAEGVALYSGWNNLTYYTEGGMTIYNMFQRQVAKEDGQKISIEEALQKHSFGKIYLEIGINEMGTGTLDSFMEAYESAVNHLRELQPDAILYLCGIMYVKQSKSESDPIFNNPNIQARNERIAQLADGENIFYLDINELVTDETGNLNPDYTWDEVHLLGKYDSLWLDYFCSHGIVKETQ